MSSPPPRSPQRSDIPSGPLPRRRVGRNYAAAMLDELLRTADTDLRGLGPQPQLLTYGEFVQRPVLDFYRRSTMDYIAQTANPTFQDYLQWLSARPGERDVLLLTVQQLTLKVIIDVMTIAATNYDSQHGTNYVSTIARLRDDAYDQSVPQFPERYLQLRNHLLDETTVGQLLRAGRYRDASDLVLSDQSQQVLQELQALLQYLPVSDYTQDVGILLIRAATQVDPALNSDILRQQLRPWLVSRLEQQFWSRLPTSQELQDYWLSPDNLSQLQLERQRVQLELREKALVELLDTIVARYADLSRIASNRLSDDDVSRSLDSSDFRQVSLGLLRTNAVVSASIDDYLTNDDWLDETSADDRVYGAIVPTLRRYLGITWEMVTDYATDRIATNILEGEIAMADVSDSILTSPNASLLLTEWVRGKVSEAADLGVVTEEDASIDVLWNSLQDPGSGLQEAITRARNVGHRETIELLVERRLVIFYGDYDRQLQLRVLDLISADDGTPGHTKYLQLLDVITPVVMATELGYLILSDPAEARDMIEEEGEPSPVVQRSLEEVANNLQLEVILYRTTGRNLTTRLVERGEITTLRPPDDGARRRAVVVDLRDLLPLTGRDGADLRLLLTAEESPLTYRSSAMPVLRRAVTLGYWIIIHSIPPLTPPYLLRSLRLSLPSLQLVVLPWDLPELDVEQRREVAAHEVGGGRTPEWSEASSLEVLLRHSVVPDTTSVLVVPRLPRTDDRTYRPTIESHNTLTTSLSVTWFDMSEIFPSTYNVRQLRVRAAQHTLLLVVPLGIDISDITQGMGLPRDAVTVVSHWGEIDTSMTGVVSVLNIISEYELNFDEILELNFDEITTALRNLLAGLDDRRMFNVRLVWYCGSPVRSNGTSGGPPLNILGETTELLPLLDGPPVRYET